MSSFAILYESEGQNLESCFSMGSHIIHNQVCIITTNCSLKKTNPLPNPTCHINVRVRSPLLFQLY